jgi:hypothetical protein
MRVFIWNPSPAPGRPKAGEHPSGDRLGYARGEELS